MVVLFMLGGALGHRYAAFQADAFGRVRVEPTSSLCSLLVVSPVVLILPESPPSTTLRLCRFLEL